MKRSIMLCAVALLLSGCKSSTAPGPDPFFGQTTVPPPGTGAAVPPGSFPGAPGTMLTPPGPTGYAGGPTGATAPPVGSFGTPSASPGMMTPPAYTGGSPAAMPAGRPTAPGYPAAMPAATGGYPAGGTRPGIPAPGTWGTQPTSPSGTFNPYAPPSNQPYRTSATSPAYGTNAGATASPPPAPGAAPGNTIRIPEPAASRPLGTFAGASAAALPTPATLPADLGRPVTADPASVLTGRQAIVRPLQTRPAATDPAARGAFATGEPPDGPTAPAPTSPTLTPRRSVNITELPDADATTPADTRTASAGDMRWTSDKPTGGIPAAAPPGATMAGVQKMSFKADAPYGYDTSYQWLRGQLDYAPGNGGWRINYVPAYGERDRLGGSVAIANPQALTGLQRGDHVELRGQVLQRWMGGAMASVYQVASAQRITAAGQ